MRRLPFVLPCLKAGSGFRLREIEQIEITNAHERVLNLRAGPGSIDAEVGKEIIVHCGFVVALP